MAPLAGLWVTYNFTARYDAARKVVDEMFQAAERSSDDSVLVQAHHTAVGAIWVGDFLACRQHAMDLVALYDEERHRQHRFLYLGHDPAVCGSACGALAHWMLGDVDSGAAAIADAEALGRRLNHVPSLAHALWLKAKYAKVARDPRTTLAAAEEVLALAREFRLAVYEASALSHKGWALVHLGEVEEGNQLLEAGLAMWRSQRSSIFLPHRLCLLAEGRLAAGRRDEALAIIDEALDQIERTNEQFLASKARLIQGEALLSGSRVEREHGQQALEQALALARRQSARSMELRISTRLAGVWAEQGERRKAHDFLAPILGSFASDLDGTDLKEARELLQVL